MDLNLKSGSKPLSIVGINSANDAAEYKSRDRSYKSDLGQFLTPIPIANFMASMFSKRSIKNCRLLDAGAGVGTLSCALLNRWNSEGIKHKNISVNAFEIDDSLIPYLDENLTNYTDVESTIHSEDFISSATATRNSEKFTHAILNPPYKKIGSKSKHRELLRSVGIETGNLYSAFVALALREMEEEGEVIAIIPRSFCNGPYFKPFRKFILENAAITHLHLFKSRTDAFKGDAVLQENIIIGLKRGTAQNEVIVSTSTDSSFSDLTSHKYNFEQIVTTGDADQFFNIPTKPDKVIDNDLNFFSSSLEDIGACVSTGPVVGFRLREHLRDDISEGCSPLIYPAHLRNGSVNWPLEDGKKANAIHRNENTQKWLYPNGFYCLVRRFSSKEERHRIVASVISPEVFGQAEFLGIDNKLNVYHFDKKGISENLAHGLAAFLNTDWVDEEFRLFSGHTQVNATDLRRLRYPSNEKLIKLGKWILKQNEPTQDEIYKQLGISVG